MKIDEINELCTQLHDVKLSEKGSHVIQIWSDGEVTSQKGGVLLWEQSLHTLQTPISKTQVLILPESKNGYTYTYAYVTMDDAMKIRELLKELVS